MDGKSYGLILGTILAFLWTNKRNPQIPVRIDDLEAKFKLWVSRI
jgi:hypothetical protein